MGSRCCHCAAVGRHSNQPTFRWLPCWASPHPPPPSIPLVQIEQPTPRKESWREERKRTALQHISATISRSRSGQQCNLVSVLLASANLINFLFSVGEKEAQTVLCVLHLKVCDSVGCDRVRSKRKTSSDEKWKSECENHLCADSGL